MNKTAILKAASGVSYDDLATALQAMGIDISRSALAARASAESDKFFDAEDYKKLAHSLQHPTEETQVVVDNLISATTNLNAIMQLYLANTSGDELEDIVDEDELDELNEDDDDDDFDNFDDFSNLDDIGDDDDEEEKKTSTKKKSKGKKNKDKSKKNKKKDKKLKSKKSKKSKKSSEDLDEIDALLNGTSTKKKGKKGKKSNKTEKGDPWEDQPSLRTVSKATPVEDPDSFEGGAFDEDDFDIDLDEL